MSSEIPMVPNMAWFLFPSSSKSPLACLFENLINSIGQ